MEQIEKSNLDEGDLEYRGELSEAWDEAQYRFKRVLMSELEGSKEKLDRVFPEQNAAYTMLCAIQVLLEDIIYEDGVDWNITLVDYLKNDQN